MLLHPPPIILPIPIALLLAPPTTDELKPEAILENPPPTNDVGPLADPSYPPATVEQLPSAALQLPRTAEHVLADAFSPKTMLPIALRLPAMVCVDIKKLFFNGDAIGYTGLLDPPWSISYSAPDR